MAGRPAGRNALRQGVRILAVADAVSPVIHSSNFPSNLGPFDVALSAGDMPGHVLEFMADKLTVPPVFVMGNHSLGNVPDPDDRTGEKRKAPGGCVNAHRRTISQAGLLIVGFEGSGRYRPGPYQYTETQYWLMVFGMVPRLLLNRLRHGRAADVLLTHAPPEGPHAGADWPHRGIRAFNWFHRVFRPRLHVHGHVHLLGANAQREYVTPEGVRVVNAFEFALIDL